MYSALFKKQDSDTGYHVGWRDKKKLEAGKLAGEMSYGEARKKAAELSAKEPEKSFWPEKTLEITRH